jgi:ATP-dependent DNA ligase
MPLQRRPEAFDHPDWLFELKYDGFRALAIMQSGRTQFLSRNGYPFASFADLEDAITADLDVKGKTVLDGEIVCVDRRGRPQFKNLLFHRSDPCFFVFDSLMVSGKDYRCELLIDRKQELRRLVKRVPVTSRLQYVDHVDGSGTALFQRVCDGLGRYCGQAQIRPLCRRPREQYLVKILNRRYSQKQGREQLFERDRLRSRFQAGIPA